MNDWRERLSTPLTVGVAIYTVVCVLLIGGLGISGAELDANDGVYLGVLALYAAAQGLLYLATLAIREKYALLIINTSTVGMAVAVTLFWLGQSVPWARVAGGCISAIYSIVIFSIAWMSTRRGQVDEVGL
jgi:hypothetical protein